MDTLCRVCIDKATKCTPLNTKIEDSSNLTFFDFLNKCASLNTRERDNLPQSLCSICSHSMKTFYSFVKLAEKSDIIFREALKPSIATGKYNDNREISYEELIIRNERIEQETDDFNKEGSLYYQTRENSSGSSLYILDIVKEEPRISENTPIVGSKDAEDNESENSHSILDQEESIAEPGEILSCIDSDLESIDADLSDSENDAHINLLKKGLVKNPDESDSQAKGDSLKPHIRGHTENTYKCIECNIVFIDREEFRRHCRNHIYEGDHQCNICGKKFARHKNLQSHLVFHEENRKYKCSICGKGFKHSSGRLKHMTMHGDEVYFECKTCGKIFFHKETYDSHLQVHLDISFKCRHCGKLYKTKKYLLAHIKAQKYKCKICGRIFCSKQYFKFHMEDHNNKKSVQFSATRI